MKGIGQIMLLGKEQVHNSEYSKLERAYISLFGMPIIGLRIRARNIFTLIPPSRNYKNILDAGSGPGIFSFELGRRFPEAQILGIDPLESAIDVCREITFRSKVTNVVFLKKDIESLEEKNFFELILCVDILEHVENDLKVLKTLFDVACPGGILVLHVPALYRRYPIWKKSHNFDVETHVRIGYRIEEIQEKVMQIGFSILDSGFTYGFWETLANNISYMITRARMKNKTLYSFVFPLLYLISWFGPRARPKELGAGIFIVAEK